MEIVSDRAQDWYDDYAAHLSTRRAGDVEIQAIPYEWLMDEPDDDVLLAEHADEFPSRMTANERRELLALARHVRGVAEELAMLWDAAYATDNTEYIRSILARASAMEREHGDDPTTQSLRRELLGEP